MKKRFLVFSLSFLMVATLFAQKGKFNPLITGVPSLGITPDARAGAMGDVGVATTPDINSQFWNPAKYAFMESPAGFSMSYTPWLSKLVNDINLVYTSGYYKLDEIQSFSGSLRYFSLGEIKLTSERPGEDYGTAQPNELALDIAYSRMLSDKFSASVAFRYIRSDLSNGINTAGGTQLYPGNAVAADVAGYYRTPIQVSTGDAQFAMGVNISNIGSKISYTQGETSLFIPTNFRLGASFDYPFDEYNKLSISADINKLLVPTPPKRKEGESDNDLRERFKEYDKKGPVAGILGSFTDAPGGFSEELQEITYSIGTEYSYNNQFFLRGGYFKEHEMKGNRNFFSMGAGFKMNMFQLDAAYLIATGQTNPLDQTLRFTLGFDLNGIKNLVK